MIEFVICGGTVDEVVFGRASLDSVQSTAGGSSLQEKIRRELGCKVGNGSSP